MDYDKFLANRITLYLDQKAEDDSVDPTLPFLDLNWSHDHTSYFSKLVKHKIVTAKDVSRQKAAAERADVICEGLGEVPKCVRDYARIYSQNINVQISYKGAIRIPGMQCPSILDYARGARLTADELELPFARLAINDAIEEYHAHERDNALDAVKVLIEPRGNFDWIGLAQGCFDLSTMSAEFVAAVLRKTVWQVKRKLWGLSVSHHLMPVLFGCQGSGKSWFLTAFSSPIRDLTTWTDFDAICDERNIDLWRSFLIIMDEMAKAAKSDIEVTKHVISADYMEKRPMRTNTSITIRQLAAFFGASNVSLVELIRDETGNRRFVELPWLGAEHGFVDSFDFTAAWQSVHHEDPDPMVPFMDELRALQSESRNFGPVESWLIQLDDRQRNELLGSSYSGGFITTAALFEHYLRHRQTVNGGSEREHRTMSAFSAELARVSGQTDYGLEKKRTNKANGFKLTRPADKHPSVPASEERR